MRSTDEIIIASNISFMKIANRDVLKGSSLEKVAIEDLEKDLKSAQTRHSHVYVWETDDVPADCAAIIIMRPSDVKKLKETNGKRKKLEEFVRTGLPKRNGR